MTPDERGGTLDGPEAGGQERSHDLEGEQVLSWEDPKEGGRRTDSGVS